MLYNKDWAYQLNPVADTLLKAADLLEARGHTKFARKDSQGRMCFLGALEIAQGNEFSSSYDTEITMSASEAVLRTLGLGVPSHYEWEPMSTMANWNNLPERTGQEVIDAMRLTASKLLEKETTHAV